MVSFHANINIITTNMSKQDDVFDVHPEELPPPYTSTNPSLQDVTSLLSSHLRSLPARIASARVARASEREGRDGEILALLTPHIEDMIHAMAAREPPLSQMEIIMVPADEVGDGWSSSDDHRVRNVVKVQEVRTKGDSKQSTSIPSSRDKPFDEWGRWEDKTETSPKASLWWSDDDMASRLAKYLQPDRLRHTKPQSRHVVEPPKQAKRSGWGLFGRNFGSIATTKSPPPDEELVSMTARAEEVTFRKENEMGLWESRTGWGLVVRIKVRQ